MTSGDVAGPELLTLTIGSDIARGPNTPRPPCRGYLHKRTQSGLIRGWRKRWFVLTHDRCLFYYRHKRVSRHSYPPHPEPAHAPLMSLAVRSRMKAGGGP